MKKTILSNIGFDEKTEQVYRALLSLQDATVFRIAKKTGIRRTSIYHTLEKLISMGLVSAYVQRGTKRFAAESPNKLKAFFEEKMILAERAIPLLQQEAKGKRNAPNIRIFEGKEGIKSISEEILETKEKKILSIGSVARLLEATEGRFGYGERRRKKGIFSQSLRPISDPRSTRPNRLEEVRILPDTFIFPAYILMFDATVAIILFEENNTSVVITSDSFSCLMKSFFALLWRESAVI